MFLVLALASSLFSDPATPPAREVLARAETEARTAATAADDAQLRQDAEEAELTRLKDALARGGGWFAERAVRRQSATVRALVEESIVAGERARVAADARDEARERLRSVLFRDASRLSSEGDAEARAGREIPASSRYRAAAAALAEAAALPRNTSLDPWLGLDAVLPLSGRESATELDAIARAYRDVVERVDRVLESLAPQLAAASEAAAAWERLSRFRAVLDRAGGEAVDPTPGLVELRASVSRGEALRERAVANAERVEALRARVDVGPRKEAP